MSMMRRLVRVSLAVALAVGLGAGACGGDDRSDSRSQRSFAGHWTSTQWGEHYIIVDGTNMKVIYTHDNGRVIGTIDGGRFTGWWSETPSRKPDVDAGEVTWTLSGTGDKPTVDGVWSYGTGNKRENWDLTWVDSTIPAEVRAQFDQAGVFVAHP